MAMASVGAWCLRNCLRKESSRLGVRAIHVADLPCGLVLLALKHRQRNHLACNSILDLEGPPTTKREQTCQLPHPHRIEIATARGCHLKILRPVPIGPSPRPNFLPLIPSAKVLHSQSTLCPREKMIGRKQGRGMNGSGIDGGRAFVTIRSASPDRNISSLTLGSSAILRDAKQEFKARAVGEF